MGKGRDEDAVKVVHEVARRNGKTSPLSVEVLRRCETQESGQQKTDAAAAIKRKLEKINLTHVQALFQTRKLAISTALIMVVWGFIGLAFPLYNAYLPFILANRGAVYGDGSTYITYRNALIIASLGVRKSMLQCKYH